MAVLAEERLDDLEDAAMGDRSLRSRRGVQRLVAEVGVVVLGAAGHTGLGPGGLEQLGEFAAEIGDIRIRNQPRNHREPVAFHVDAGLRGRLVAKPEIAPRREYVLVITTALSHTVRHRLKAVLLRVGAAGRVVPFHREIALGAIGGDHERHSRSTG